MKHITEQKIRDIAEEYGENGDYLVDVMREAESDGEDIDEEYVRDFLEEMYRTDDIAELVMER